MGWLLEDPGIQWMLGRLRGGKTPDEIEKELKQFREGNMVRPNWDNYFIGIACEVAQRATCPRASVGAVIVKDHRIISTGYNGAPAGEPHCFDAGCYVVNDHCQRAIHAEVNAVAAAAKFGLAADGAVLYYWDSQDRPESCHNCIQVMKAAGIVKVIDRSFNATELPWQEPRPFPQHLHPDG